MEATHWLLGGPVDDMKPAASRSWRGIDAAMADALGQERSPGAGPGPEEVFTALPHVVQDGVKR